MAGKATNVGSVAVSLEYDDSGSIRKLKEKLSELKSTLDSMSGGTALKELNSDSKNVVKRLSGVDNKLSSISNSLTKVGNSVKGYNKAMESINTPGSFNVLKSNLDNLNTKMSGAFNGPTEDMREFNTIIRSSASAMKRINNYTEQYSASLDNLNAPKDFNVFRKNINDVTDALVESRDKVSDYIKDLLSLSKSMGSLNRVTNNKSRVDKSAIKTQTGVDSSIKKTNISTKKSIGLFSSMSSKLKNINKSSLDLSRLFKRLFSVGLLVAFTKKVKDVGAGMIELMSESSRVNKVAEKSFAEFGDEVDAFVESYSKMYGLEPNKLKNSISVLYNISTVSGMAADQALHVSKNMALLAYDLQITAGAGKSLDDVLVDLRSAYVGQTEGIQKYGIQVEAAFVKQLLLNKGLDVNYDKLSAAGKMQARYIAIMMQTEAKQGIYAESLTTINGRLLAIKNIFRDTATMIANFFAPIINNVLGKILKLLMIARAVVKQLKNTFNIKDVVGASGVDVLSDGMETLGDKTEEAGKKAKKALAPFDDIIVASEETDDATSTLSSATPGMSVDDAKVSEAAMAMSSDWGLGLELTPEDAKTVDSIVEKIEALKVKFDEAKLKITDFKTKLDEFKEKYNISFEVFGVDLEPLAPLIAFLGLLAAPKLLSSIGLLLGEGGLLSKIGTILAPALTSLGSFISSLTLIPLLIVGLVIIVGLAFADLFKTDEEFRNGVIDSWNKFKDFFTQVVDDIWGSITRVWDEYGQDLIDNFKRMWADIKGFLKEVFDNILKPVFDDIIEKMTYLWDRHLSKFVDGILELGAEIGLFIGNIVSALMRWWKILAKIFGPGIKATIGTFVNVFVFAFELVMNAINYFVGIIKGFFKIVNGIFTGDMEKVGEGFKDIFVSAFNNVAGILDAVATFFVNSINNVIKAINSIEISFPDWEVLPDGIQGKSWSPELKQLAQPESLKIDMDNSSSKNVPAKEVADNVKMREEKAANKKTTSTGSDVDVDKEEDGLAAMFSAFKKDTDSKNIAAGLGDADPEETLDLDAYIASLDSENTSASTVGGIDVTALLAGLNGKGGDTASGSADLSKILSESSLSSAMSGGSASLGSGGPATYNFNFPGFLAGSSGMQEVIRAITYAMKEENRRLGVEK